MNLEEALQSHEEQVDALLKSANRYVGTLKAWKKACQTGHLVNRQKAAGQAVELAPTLFEPTVDASNSWTFDARTYLETEEWRRELQTAAEKLGLRVLEDNETLVSSPVVIRSQPGSGRLVLGKVVWSTIQPRLIATELKRLRDRAANANSQEFANALQGAWLYLRQDENPFIKFRTIYDLFSLTPGWKKENPDTVFGQAIYALHRSEIRVTGKGYKFEMDTPSGNAKEKDVFNVIAEDGRPLRYYGITFR